jgi:hypothetical protein
MYTQKEMTATPGVEKQTHPTDNNTPHVIHNFFCIRISIILQVLSCEITTLFVHVFISVWFF